MTPAEARARVTAHEYPPDTPAAHYWRARAITAGSEWYAVFVLMWALGFATGVLLGSAA